MRFPAAVLALVLMASCTPVRETPIPPPAGVSRAVEPAAAAEKPAAPLPPPQSARVASREISGILFEGLAFDSRSHRLIVADQAGGPGTEFPDAAAATRALGGIAAVNAGFFTPEGTPLGLVVSSGKRAGAWNSASSLGGGVWHEDASGKSAITRRENLGRGGASTMREVLQAGPMLIENQRAVSGLDSIKSSVRTILLWDGGSRWWIGRTSACTLAETGRAIASGNPGGWPARHALNLDGGRSSDLWISDKIQGGPLSRRPAWNRPVRNFLVLKPR